MRDFDANPTPGRSDLRHVGSWQMNPAEVVVLTDKGLDPLLVDEWRALVAGTPSTSYFQTPDWILSWWRFLAGRPPTEVALWRDVDGRLDAVVAVSEMSTTRRRKFPLSLPFVTNAGSGPGDADHCGWVYAPERRAAIGSWLRERAGRVPLYIRNVRDESSLLDGATAIATQRCPVLQIPEDLERLGSRNFNKKLRKYARILAREGVTFRWIAADEITPHDLESLIRVHTMRRASLGAATAFDHTQLDLHLELARRGTRGRGPVMVLAEHEGAVVAAGYGFLWNDTFADYQSGWDPAWASSGLGTALGHQMIRMTAERGVVEYDFLRGTEEYKYRFGAKDQIDASFVSGSFPLAQLLRLGEGGRPGWARASSGD